MYPPRSPSWRGTAISSSRWVPVTSRRPALPWRGSSRRDVADRPRTADASVRLAHRRRQQLRRRILRVAIALVVAAVIAGGVWVVFFSQAFAATTVSVTGT